MSVRVGALVALAVTAALVFGCGGGGGRFLTEEEGSPSPASTAPIFQRSPLPSVAVGTPGASPAATPAPAPAADVTPSVQVAVTPVAESFEVTVTAENTGLRIRETPSTNGNILGAIYQGHKAKVLGEARGQEAEPGQGDLWYQVEITQDGTIIRGFVYAPLVLKVQ